MMWYENSSNDVQGIVISSRVRLARNVMKFVFPNRLNYDKSVEVVSNVRDIVQNSDMIHDEIDMLTISKTDQVALMERHLVSPQFVNNPLAHSIFISKDESVSVMVNEEDHVRIQAMENGLNLKGALNKADKVDNLLESSLKYACSQQYGYLTSCPTNIGTGMRASLMLHVPALESTGQLPFILDAVNKFGLTVRGIYGEGSKAQGSVFQISNQVTIGITEDDIIENVQSISKQIIEQELVVRQKLLKENGIELEDTIYRSYGILTNARRMSSSEAMRLLSDIKLGIELKILRTTNADNINIFNFMTQIQPANLQKVKETQHISTQHRDELRANHIREHLPKLL